MQGFILEVSINRVGDELDTDHLTGDTVLQLIDASPFTDGEDPATEVEIDEQVYAVTVVDPLANTLTLAAPGLAGDLEAGARVYTLPATVEKWALVEVDEADEPISALIGGDLYDKLTDGVREPEDQEPVVVELQNGDWTVLNIVGEEPTQSGEFLDPTTVPVSEEVAADLGELRSDVNTNTGQLGEVLGDEDQAGRLQNVEETATQARNLANTADGRVSMSDYEPLPEDTQYVATDVNGQPILDSNGQQILLSRNEGSIWLTRTRTRVNLLRNPSFETNTTGWSTSNLTQARVLDAEPIAGSYVVELVTSTSDVAHTYSYDNGGTRTPVTQGLDYTGSIFAKLMAGSGAGVYLQLDWFNGSGASVGTSNGPAQTLLPDLDPAGTNDPDWYRLSVTAQPPAGAVTVVLRLFNPNESSTLRVDAAMIEQTAFLGRYFDGSLYDCRWGSNGLGTAHATESHMAGGKVVKVFELDDNDWIEKLFMGDTIVDIDAGEITYGFMDGERILDRSIPIDKISGVACTTSEALVAGDLVNVYSLNGAFRARKALAVPGREAHGFVLENVSSGATAYLYAMGYNPFMSGMAPGTQFLSSTVAGRTTQTAPSEPDTLIQRVGVAVGPSVLNYMQNMPIRVLS